MNIWAKGGDSYQDRKEIGEEYLGGLTFFMGTLQNGFKKISRYLYGWTS